ncbi:MAG: membrane lipoprotein lipid attachment site-containing protein [Nanoarchaeota archaeon]|nr:membrane lipoprotein lipid attachment site-containing protein [Nanoarchaeota archaeon]
MKRMLFALLMLAIIALSGCSSMQFESDFVITGAAVSDPVLKDETTPPDFNYEIVSEEEFLAEKEEECHTSKDCDSGYCVFNECQAEKPKYPVLLDVNLYDSKTHRMVKPNEDERYVLKNTELYYIKAKVDNKRNPFKILAKSDKHFGPRGLNENNLPEFKSEERSAVYAANDIYEIQISNYEPIHEYPFYFNILASPGDKFEITFYVEDGRDGSLKSQEKVFPVFIISN